MPGKKAVQKQADKKGLHGAARKGYIAKRTRKGK